MRQGTANPTRVGFFGRDDDKRDEAESLDRIIDGGVPLAAETRLSELNMTGLFTSTLSVSEFALLSGLGPTPIAQVLGAAVHQVGWQYLPPQAQWAGNDLFCQLDSVSQAWDHARRNAFDRLREEARLVGADAVVGVHLRRGKHEWARHSVDFVVSGTAIRLPGSDPAALPALLLSDLSVQDYWKLMGGGWSPAGLLATTSVFFVSQGFRTRWQRRLAVMKNQELIEFSDGFSAARRTAVADLRSQARSASANGIVGVSLQYEIARGKFAVRGVGQGGTGLSPQTIGLGGDMPSGGADKRAGVVITVHSVGTAIRHDHAAGSSAPRTTLSLGGAP